MSNDQEVKFQKSVSAGISAANPFPLGGTPLEQVKPASNPARFPAPSSSSPPLQANPEDARSAKK